MTRRNRTPLAALSLVATLAAACGGAEADPNPPYDPYAGEPPLGAAILPSEATAIPGATGWTWVPFPDSICNDPVAGGGFTTSTTGLAIKWGTGTELVVFLQGGGACWDFVTCGGASSLGFSGAATTGPYGPSEFAATYSGLPNSWLHDANLPPSLANASVVFVPYCTGDVHGGSKVMTYTAPVELQYFQLPAIQWNHAGHDNIMAFLERLGATFPSPSKLVVAGSSAGGFGALANYPAFKWYWPDAPAYLIDDSAPPLAGNAIPASTRAAWYSSWDIGVTMDAFCPSCRTDMSDGMAELASRYPTDRIALMDTLQDGVIRSFFGTFSFTYPYLTPMPAADFEAALRALGTDVMDPATLNAKYFFTTKPTIDDHPLLDDPSVVTTPGTGLADWVEQMVSDDAAWVSRADP